MNKRQRLIQSTMDLQRQITEAKLSRRDLLKMGLISATTGMFLPISGLSLRAASAQSSCPVPGKDIISPPTRPWIEELPRLVEKQTVADNNLANISIGTSGGAPGPSPIGTLTGGDSKVRLLNDFPDLRNATPYANLDHQGWGKSGAVGNFAPKQYYEMHARQFKHVWHRDMPAGLSGQAAWGFDSVVPGPMFRTRYGEPHFTRIHNDLPDQNLGFGINQLSTHMHNFHSPSESDGNPLYVNYAGHYYDYHYPNAYAGIKQFSGNGDFKPVIKDYIGRTDIGNPDEALGSLWYHDHKLDFTAQNVCAGLAGMNSIYDALDAYKNSGPWKRDPNAMGDLGDERLGWGLPCGDADSSDPAKKYEFDVGLVFHDRQFDPRGVDFFPHACFDGAIGDKMTVNGKIQPYMPVKRRKYRFRMLNMGPARVYQWSLNNGDSFVVIGADGNLFPAPLNAKAVRVSPGERYDVIIDFSKYAAGSEIILINRLEQTNGRGPTNNLLTPGDEILKFVVTGEAVVDNSRIPAKLRPLPDIDQPITSQRTWKFNRGGGEWLVNGEPYNRDVVSAYIPEGSAEQWKIINNGGSWLHPIHMHFEEVRILAYNKSKPEPFSQGRRDIVRLDPNAEADVYIRLRDYKGLYVMHCHNNLHEDHAMMVNLKII